MRRTSRKCSRLCEHLTLLHSRLWRAPGELQSFWMVGARFLWLNKVWEVAFASCVTIRMSFSNGDTLSYPYCIGIPFTWSLKWPRNLRRCRFLFRNPSLANRDCLIVPLLTYPKMKFWLIRQNCSRPYSKTTQRKGIFSGQQIIMLNSEKVISSPIL